MFITGLVDKEAAVRGKAVALVGETAAAVQAAVPSLFYKLVDLITARFVQTLLSVHALVPLSNSPSFVHTSCVKHTGTDVYSVFTMAFVECAPTDTSVFLRMAVVTAHACTPSMGWVATALPQLLQKLPCIGQHPLAYSPCHLGKLPASKLRSL